MFSTAGSATRVFQLNRELMQTIGNRLVAPVAQGIEHRFPKPVVAGSNPAGGNAPPGMANISMTQTGIAVLTHGHVNRAQ